MADGARRARKQPERSCVGCRAVRPKRELVRVVRTPSGEVVLDEGGGKLPGRGAYVCPQSDCLRRAVRVKALERALKQPVPDEVVARLEALIAQRELEASAGEADGEGPDGAR